MKIISFNTNGIRARAHQLQALVDTQRPDIIGIQETKVQDKDFPVEMIGGLGYQAVYHGQKAHYGVAIVSHTAPIEISKGFPHDDDDAQRRLITARFALTDGRQLTVLNGYFPQGESRDHETKFAAKRKFYRDLLEHLRRHHDPRQPLALIGDMNVAPLDIDIGIGEDNAKRWLRTGKCSFLPEERDWLQQLMDWGLMDTYRQRHPHSNDRFSWFDYRSRGFEREPRRGLRIDLILATQTLAETCTDAGIDYTIRAMGKPSDHCPVWADFDIA
jgi:exodeoxyribonuclease-3